MRIGLYGMPTAGKTYIMERINFIDVLFGSSLLREYDSEFDHRSKNEREKDRSALAELCKKRDNFIMDGHYAFGDELAFTDKDGEMYDHFLYLYVSPEVLSQRMDRSDKNRKYLKYDIEGWQQREIQGLRSYCHRHNKNFYVLDCPPDNEYANVEEVISFIKEIVQGYNNVQMAETIAKEIVNQLHSGVVTLLDGDKTFISEDSSSVVFDYNTHVFDGNFYTGFQTWKQYREFEYYNIKIPEKVDVHRNHKMPEQFIGDAFIISSGNNKIWEKIASQFSMPYFSGNSISAETKFFVAKFLRNRGIHVVAYGDSMCDLYMLREANEGYLVRRQNGGFSRSLRGQDLGGIHNV